MQKLLAGAIIGIGGVACGITFAIAQHSTAAADVPAHALIIPDHTPQGTQYTVPDPLIPDLWN